MLRVLSLFSGIDAFDLGLERAGGFKAVALCEIDPFCRDILARHWPDVPILEDVRTAEFPDADVICGGFPCQDVSRAGKRAGITGERSGLYRELVRAIRVVRPRVAILENVAALLDDGMGDVLGDLAESGNCVEWDCVPANAIGAPHQRDRVWIVAHASSADDGSGDPGTPKRQEREPGSRSGETPDSNASSVRCGPGRQGRPPDSFAWVRDATRWHAGHAYRTRLQEWQGERDDARSECQAAQRATLADVWKQEWPREPALLGVDDGVADRVDRTKALGNALIPQIPELIGRAVLEAA